MNFVKNGCGRERHGGDGSEPHRNLGRGTGGCKGFNNRIGCGVGDGSGCGFDLDEGTGITFGKGSSCDSKTGGGEGPGYGRGNGVMT